MRGGCEGLRPRKPGLLRSGRRKFLKMQILENERLDLISRGDTTRSERSESASEKSRGFLRGFARIQTAAGFLSTDRCRFRR